MKLLIITQKVDKKDPILGFFHNWIKEFSKRYESLLVICLEQGNHDLPANVKVLSLGKEEGRSVFKYVFRFYKYVWSERKNYDSVFVHMNPEYVDLGGLFWRIWKKRIGLWYVHRQTNLRIWLAEKFADIIFTSAPESFRLKSKKVHYVGHGIDTEIFRPLPRGEESRQLLHVGRITPIKHCEVLIEAVEILKKENPRWRAVFIGEPVTEADKRYFESLEGDAVFLGSMPPEKVNEEFSRSFASVNMTPTGGMDKAVLESLAAGCPAFTSNKIFKHILPDELIFESGDSADLARKIAGSPREAELKRAFSDVRSNYGLSEIINKITHALN